MAESNAPKESARVLVYDKQTEKLIAIFFEPTTARAYMLSLLPQETYYKLAYARL